MSQKEETFWSKVARWTATLPERAYGLLVGKQQYEDRMRVCESCPHVRPLAVCGKCRCMLVLKARLRKFPCPDKPNRWAGVDAAYDEPTATRSQSNSK